MSASSDGDGQPHRRDPGRRRPARAAGGPVRARGGAQGTRVVLRANGREADAASILQVLALGATGGTPIEVEASGEAAEPAVDAIADLLASLS